jgi:hypothetical protein
MILDPEVEHVIRPVRRIPTAIKEDVKKALDNMEAQGIIEKVSEPTEWVSAMVVVKKPSGDLRVCIDPGDLNKAIMRPHYPIHTIEETIEDIAGAQIFSVLDAKNAFFSIKLDSASSAYTTFATPFGHYKYLRLPTGKKQCIRSVPTRNRTSVNWIPMEGHHG